jgi:hypothetical protein
MQGWRRHEVGDGVDRGGDELAATEIRTSMSAQACLTAWIHPMGRPNWCRTPA